MNVDMTNIAYTKIYRDGMCKNESVFSEEYFKHKEFYKLSFDYSLEKNTYNGKINNLNLTASENILRDNLGNEIYRYRNIDTGGDFSIVIKHSNDHLYLIFRTDLYGYGVFDLTEKTEFLHIPKGPESFIWTDINYNPKNNILIVSGCFWACPYGIHILDFTNPMIETKWIDVQEKLDENFEKYDNIDFSYWENDTLVLKVEVVVTGKTEEIRIQKEEYNKWFNN